MFSLTPFRIEDLPKPAAPSSVGATVIFEGIVRDVNDDHQVEALEYEAMESLAVKEGAKILAQALAKFPIESAECIHRTGLLQVGEVAIRVVVSAAHRKEAFGACEFIVNEVKSRVPIWKKEHYSGGATEWINADQM